MSTALSESTCTTDGQLKINADRKTNGPPPCCPCHRNIKIDNIDLIRSTKQTLTGVVVVVVVELVVVVVELVL